MPMEVAAVVGAGVVETEEVGDGDIEELFLLLNKLTQLTIALPS